MQNVLLFINPLFHQTRRQRVTMERVAATLRGAGLRVESIESRSAEESGAQVKRALADEFDTVFICGGDGTLFHALQGLVGGEAAVGIIPLGTGNVVAQNLRLSRDPLEAAQMLLTARLRRVPLGHVTCSRASAAPRGWHFLFTTGMGLHAALMNLAPEGQGKRIGGRAAYYFGGVNLLLHAPLQPFEIEITSTENETTVLQVSEAIAVKVPEINRWRPGGTLGGATLRVAVVPRTSRLGLAHASIRALALTVPPDLSSGISQQTNQTRLPRAQYLDAVQMVCRPIADFDYREPLLVQADGEVLGDSLATIRSTAQTIGLLCPSPHLF